MRTSLSEIKKIEDQLQLVNEDPALRLVWESQLLADAELNKKVKWQKKVYQLIRYFGRKDLKKELEAIHQNLILNPEKISFQLKVRNIFLNP